MTSSRLASPLAPIAVIVATLLALAIAPIAVARRQAGPRARMDRIMDAQVVVNDLQEALASADGTPAQLRGDARRLVSDARGLDRDAEGDARTLDTLVERGGVRAGDVVHAAPLSARARRLEQRLDDLAFVARAQLFDAARWNRTVPAALVPLALVSVVLVALVARGAIADAAAAEAGRRAYARAMEEKAALTRGITHDLKNPLSATIGYVRLLRDGIYGDDGDGRRDEPLRRIEALVRAALATVNDLLDVASHEGGADAPPSIQPLDLDGLVRDLADDYRPSAHAAGLALRLSEIARPAVATTDVRRVRRIVENLLSNAIKYTPAGGVVTLGLDARDGEWVVAVADTGPGIPPALRERIFDEFYRAPRAAATGAGIGLTSSRRMARGLGGDLVVRPGGDGGSVFELCLPAVGAGEETLLGGRLSTRHAVPTGRPDDRPSVA